MSKKRYTFKPKHHNYNNGEYLIDKYYQNNFTVKSDNVPNISHDVNTEIVEEMLNTLKDNKNNNIKDLTGKAKQTYETFISLVRCLKGTEAYNTLYAMVNECFKDEKNPIPGTILGYLKGCMVNDNNGESVGCNITCAQGLPPPDDHDCKCKYKVILATKRNNTYNFKVIQNSKSNRAIIYFTNCSNSKNFNGFAPSECNKLKELKVDEVKLRGICEITGSYNEITNGFVKHDMVKPKTKDNNNNDESDDNLTVLVIILIVLLLILLFIGWRILESQDH